MNIWEKIKAIYTGERRWFAWFVTVSLALFIYSWLFGRGNTILHWIDAKREISRQEAQIDEYQRQIDDMDCTIDQRQTDLDTLEKFAREQYNFAEPGEDVYIIK